MTELIDSKSRMDILKQLQEHFAEIAPGVSLADELIAERRKEAMSECSELIPPTPPLKRGVLGFPPPF
jgi:hypothetical protein